MCGKVDDRVITVGPQRYIKETRFRTEPEKTYDILPLGKILDDGVPKTGTHTVRIRTEHEDICAPAARQRVVAVLPIQSVCAAAAIELVVVVATCQVVVARFTIEPVGATATKKPVIAGTAV